MSMAEELLARKEQMRSIVKHQYGFDIANL